jgi:hypothetical protein
MSPLESSAGHFARWTRRLGYDVSGHDSLAARFFPSRVGGDGPRFAWGETDEPFVANHALAISVGTSCFLGRIQRLGGTLYGLMKNHGLDGENFRG